MTTVTISLPTTLKKFVQKQVKTRGYGNVSEYFRGLLRDAQQRESQASLERQLIAGLDSGDEVAVDARFWKDLQSDIRKLALERRKSIE